MSRPFWRCQHFGSFWHFWVILVIWSFGHLAFLAMHLGHFGTFGHFGFNFGSFFVKNVKKWIFRPAGGSATWLVKKNILFSDSFLAGPKMPRPIFAGPKMPRPIFARQKRPPEPDNFRTFFFFFFSNVVFRADSDFGHDSPSRGPKMQKMQKNLKKVRLAMPCWPKRTLVIDLGSKRLVIPLLEGLDQNKGGPIRTGAHPPALDRGLTGGSQERRILILSQQGGALGALKKKNPGFGWGGLSWPESDSARKFLFKIVG